MEACQVNSVIVEVDKMSILDELRVIKESHDLEEFRRDLLAAVNARAPEGSDIENRDFAFVCEFSERLADAEEFQDFIPSHGSGIGHRRKKLRVDGYELDEADDSIRLLVADFKGENDLDTITKTQINNVFAQLKAFIEESCSGQIWSSSLNSSLQTRELSGIIEQRHELKTDGSRSVSRYRCYLITDSLLSDSAKELSIDEIDGIPVEYHIWDISRLKAVSSSILGTEELEIDFTEFVDDGLQCLKACQTENYESYLAVIPGNVLVNIYERYGSRLLEGNVRSFLNTSVKVNKGIQKTIRAEPDKFFIYNNGISATATSANIRQTEKGPKLVSVKYLQIVNGGQTTASLHVAKRKDNADLSAIQVQMKLSVVLANESEQLDDLIQKIARYSNSQNKVSDVDFFSNHSFHRMIERYSRGISAPRNPGATFSTFWFYERARGQYFHAQSKMKISEKKIFLRQNPRAQLISKTDLAKFENSWRQLPHVVARAAQKNFIVFAEYIEKNYGSDGSRFDNEVYFKEVISKAIMFRFVENMVSAAKKTWYAGDYRAQIVTYTIAKLVSIIEELPSGLTLKLNQIWERQAISSVLSQQLELIAKFVAIAITTPPVQSMNVGEWCKKEDCWNKVKELSISIISGMEKELCSTREIDLIHKDAAVQAKEDIVINGVVEVVALRKAGCWQRLDGWTKQFSPVFGKEADLLRLASRANWVPTDRQAVVLIKMLKRLEQDGFKTS